MIAIRRVQLVHPPNDDKYSGLRTGYTSYPPPSGLAILAACVEKSCPGVAVEVFDGNVQSVDEIARSLDGDLIGVSDWFTSHGNAIRLAKAAKKANPNAIVVLGGPNATNLARRILHRHKEVDFVVHGDGEESLPALVLGSEPAGISNLWFRNSAKDVVFTGQTCTDIDKLPLFDFRHLVRSDLAKYGSRNWADADLNLTPVPISSIRGCLKAEKRGACSYCSMPSRTLRMADPACAWRQIAHLNARHGMNYFFETGDSFAVGDYPERLLRARPRGLDVRFRNYAHPASLNADNIRIFRELGVVEVFIGVESIDEDVLRRANKPYDTANVEKTVALLEKQGIRVFLPFLFGLPGETYDSVKESSGFARYLVEKYRNIQRVLFSLAIPLVGTRWFSDLVADRDLMREYDDHGRRSLAEDDGIDYERLVLLSLRRHCRVSFSDIYATLAGHIAGIPRERVAGFGCLENNVRQLACQLG